VLPLAVLPKDSAILGIRDMEDERDGNTRELGGEGTDTLVTLINSLYRVAVSVTDKVEAAGVAVRGILRAHVDSEHRTIS
jgi:hypothetical protein